jgi:hypothetical protein
MALPNNTATVLQFMFPTASPITDWEVRHFDGAISIAKWSFGSPQPTEAEIIAAAATPEFAAWLDVHTDPIKQARAEAKQEVISNAPRVIGERANSLVIYQAIVGTRQRYNALLNALVAKGVFTSEEAAAFAQPIRSTTEVIASRQALIDAGLAEVHAE